MECAVSVFTGRIYKKRLDLICDQDFGRLSYVVDVWVLKKTIKLQYSNRRFYNKKFYSSWACIAHYTEYWP